MSSRRFSVGYALAPKKEQSFIQLSLVNHAKERGIDLVRIDTTRPLVEQGPFDCVIHKLYGHEWKSRLYEFSSQNPSVPIIDAPDAIERLHNRVSMLEVVKQLEVSQELNTFGIPKQIVIYRSEELFPPSKLGGLEFPVIAKPLVADGSAKSHKMSLVFNQEGFHKLKPPLVLQEFVNHGGAIFKVYVVGEYVKCVKRRSLPDVSEEKLLTLEGSLPFSQISNLTAQEHGEKDSGNDDNDSCDFNETNLEDVEMPPPAFLTGIARGLRQALKLNLFNFDVIRDSLVGNRYLVIDINYFPGYAKMPCYESALTDFFWEVVHLKRNGTENMEVKTESQKPFVKEEKKVHVNNSCCGGDDVGIPSTSPPISGENDNVI